MVEIVSTDDFAGWYADLDAGAAEDVTAAVDYLAVVGVALGFPRSSAIAGASFALRELRVQSGGNPIRVFYAFDPKRQAVLLLGGDKTGDERFYKTMIPACERIWGEYMAEIEEEES